MKRLLLLAFTATLITTACKKDIRLDLQKAAGLIVIEGGINNQPGPYYVGISRTITYYDSSEVAPVDGAQLVMSDDAGNVDTLIATGWPGLYQTNTIVGTVGRTYHLTVVSDGKQYDAWSTMPPPVQLDSIGAQVIALQGKTYWGIYGIFQDPQVTNYYKAFLYVNNEKQSAVTVINDELNNGLISQTYVSPDFFSQEHDTIQMQLDAIDKPVYDYFNTLQQSTLSQTTAAPANPKSNFSNGALGYFSAYSPMLSHHIALDAGGFHRVD